MCCLPDSWFIPVVFIFIFCAFITAQRHRHPFPPACFSPVHASFPSARISPLVWAGVGVGKAGSGLCVLVPTPPLCPVAPAWFINVPGSWAPPPRPPALLLGQKQQLLSTRQLPHQPDCHAPKSPLHSFWSFSCCVSADRAQWNCLTSLGEEENHKKIKLWIS